MDATSPAVKRPARRAAAWYVLRAMKGFRAAATALLAVFVALAVPSAIGDSATFDETAHLPAGIAYLEHRDFRLNAEHPPLAKLWAAVAVVALGRAELQVGKG